MTRVLSGAALVIVAVGVVWFVLRPFLIWLTATYAITTRRLITRHATLSDSRFVTG